MLGKSDESCRCAIGAGLATLLLMGAISGPLGTAQTISGSITGTVTDSTGAVVAGADVRVINQQTGVERHVVTSGTGVYNVPSLNPGIYKVRIEQKGFTTYERTGLQLNANQVINVDAQLTVAPTGTEIQVVETPPVVDSQTGTLVNLKTELELRDLPLVSRRSGDQRTQSYVLLNPGVTWSRGGWVAGNGMRFLDSVPTVDGMVVMAQVSGGGGPWFNRVWRPRRRSASNWPIPARSSPGPFNTAPSLKPARTSSTAVYFTITTATL